jgi:hypothetical protein
MTNYEALQVAHDLLPPKALKLYVSDTADLELIYEVLSLAIMHKANGTLMPAYGELTN